MEIMDQLDVPEQDRGMHALLINNFGASPLRRNRDNGTVLPDWVSASSEVEVRILMSAAKIHLAYSFFEDARV